MLNYKDDSFIIIKKWITSYPFTNIFEHAFNCENKLRK